MALIQTPENVESATIRTAAPGNGAGKQSVAIQLLPTISPPQNPIRNQLLPYLSLIQLDLLSNHPSGSSLPQLSLLLISSHLNSQLRLPLVRRGIIRMLRAR